MLLEILGFVAMILWFVFFIYFLIIFFKNDSDLSKTLNYLKQNLLQCCFKKDKLVSILGKEKADEIQLDMANFSDCKNPVGTGFPLDICMSEELVKEEIMIREKLLKLLKEKDSYVISDGKKKLVIPLEATLFLTKSLNPLVNERGEIQITAKHKPVLDQIEKLILQLKESGELIYEDDAELFNSLKELLESAKNYKKTAFSYEDPEEKNITYKEELISEKIEKSSTELMAIDDSFNEDIQLEEPINFIKDSDEKDLFMKNNEDVRNNDADIIDDSDDFSINLIDIEEQPEDDVQPKKQYVSSSTPFDDEEDYEIDFKSIEDEIDMELNDILSDSLDDFEEQSTDNNNVKEFYLGLNFQTSANNHIDFEHIKDSVKKVFSKTETIGSFFRNLAKTTPMSFSDNKEVVFVDQLNVYYAIAKLYGMESKTYIDKLSKLKKDDIISLNEGISESLEMYLSDLISGTKSSGLFIIENKSGQLFKSFGFCFQTNAFKTGLSHNEFDYFRSFPYDNDHKIKQAGGSKEFTNSCPKLITDIKAVEIN